MKPVKLSSFCCGNWSLLSTKLDHLVPHSFGPIQESITGITVPMKKVGDISPGLILKRQSVDRVLDSWMTSEAEFYIFCGLYSCLFSPFRDPGPGSPYRICNVVCSVPVTRELSDCSQPFCLRTQNKRRARRGRSTPGLGVSVRFASEASKKPLLSQVFRFRWRQVMGS